MRTAEATLDAFADILANDPGPLVPSDGRYVSNLHGRDAEDVIAAPCWPPMRPGRWSTPPALPETGADCPSLPLPP